MADEVNMHIQLLCRFGKNLHNLSLNVILVLDVAGDVQGHQIVDDDHIRFLFLYPVKDDGRDRFPAVTVVVVVNSKGTAKQLVQLLLNAFLQAVMIRGHWIGFHLVFSGSLQVQPVLHKLGRHFAGKHGHLISLMNRFQTQLANQGGFARRVRA